MKKNRANPEESRALAKEWSTPARELVSVMGGEKIAEPLIYVHKTLFHQFYELRFHSKIKALIQQALDAEELPKLDEIFEQACKDASVTKEWAEHYFESNRYKTWLKDRVQELKDQDDLTIPFLRNIELKVIKGEIKLDSGQHQSLERMEKRIWPEVTRQDITITKKEAVTLDDLPDYEKKVQELEKKFRDAIPTTAETKDVA